MGFTSSILEISLGLFVGMLVLLELGRRIGVRMITGDPEGAHKAVGAVEGAIFALLGLLIAFTFSGAASRLDTRRQLIAEETNAMGTAYLRLDLLSGEVRRKLREDFRRYVDLRLDLYRKFADPKVAETDRAKMAALQADIWNQAVAACKDQGSQAATMLLLPALNQMIDITTTRAMVARMHPPFIIYAMLFILALVSALTAGYGMAGQTRRSWLHVLGFCAIIAFTAYVILDLEHPRFGLIRIDQADQTLLDLRQSLK
jgi:hypothetical protein